MKPLLNKIITGFILLTFLVSQTAVGVPNALALGVPYAVQGQVTLNGLVADGASVVLTDVNTGATTTDIVGPTGLSGISGWYSLDLGNLSIAATNGDTIKIVATINSQVGSTTFVYNPVVSPSFVTPATINITTPPPTTFSIVASTGANGTVSPLGTSTISSGASTTYSITPNGGFNVLNVLVDGVAQGAISTYTFTNVLANHTISATFTAAPITTYTIVATSSANGIISPVGTSTVNSGTNLTFTMTPNVGYNVQDVLVDGVSVGAVSSYTFTSVLTNHTIVVSFVLVPLSTFMLTASAGPNGSITPPGISMLTTGASTTYTMTPNAGYEVASVLIDGATSTATSTYTFTNITSNHTISVSFRAVPVITTLTVAPATTTISAGTSTQFTVTKLDQYSAPINTVISWSSSNPAVATVNTNGLASALTAGTATIFASGGGLIASAVLTVTPPPVLTTITLAPTQATVVAGVSQQFTASTFDQFGLSFAAPLTWTSSNLGVASVNSSGLVTTTAAGTSTITATNGAISQSAVITVTPVPVLTTINVTPTTTSVVVGNSAQFSATTLDQFGAAFSSPVTWSSSNPLVASISNTGFVTTLLVGTTTISASSGGVIGLANLTVTPTQVVTTITLSAATSSLVAGNSQQYTASTVDQFGAPIATTLGWSSSNSAVATVSSTTGLVTAVAAGTTIISATSGGVVGSALLTVTPAPALNSIALTPTSTTIMIGGLQQFGATLLDQFGSPFTSTLTWLSSNTNVVTVSNQGVATAIATGTATITASSSGIIGSATLTVIPVPPTLTAIHIASSSTSLVLGQTQQFTASTVDQYGLPFSAAVNWGTSNHNIGTISASGLFTSVATGTVIITATNGNINSTTSITVLPDAIAPSVPTSLLATAVSSSQINLSWNASTDNVGVTNYLVYRNGTSTPIATTSSTTYSDNSLTPVTIYTYTVVAQDAAGNKSAFATESSATTQQAQTGGSGGGGGSSSGGGGSYTPQVTIPEVKATTTEQQIRPDNSTESVPVIAPIRKVLGEKVYNTGALIQDNAKKVYVVINKMRKLIGSEAEIKKFSTKTIIKVTDQELKKYKLIEHGPFFEGDIFKTKDNKFHLVKNGGRQQITAANDLKKLKANKKIKQITPKQLDLYPVVK